MDRQAGLAALFLLLTPGPLAEVLSQNVQLSTFVQPVPFLLVTLTYGVPLLVIRELSVARELDEVGLVVLGLAYGILNEGVLAKTLTLPDGAPLHDFAGYGQLGPIQGGWSVFIIVWHALHSVLYPVLLTRWMFPAAAERRWFAAGRARWLLYVLLVLLAGLYALYFLNPERNDPAVFVLYALATAGLVAAALRLRKRRDESSGSERARPSTTPALLGGAMIVFYLFQFWAPRHVPFAVFLAVSSCVVGVLVAALMRGRWRPVPEWLLFGLGDYITFCIFSAIVCVADDRNPVQAVAAMAIFLVVSIYLVRSIMRRTALPGAVVH
jgi:hypothetical protein